MRLPSELDRCWAGLTLNGSHIEVSLQLETVLATGNTPLSESDWEIISGGSELLDTIEPLWQQLKSFHIAQFPVWRESLLGGQFADRKAGLIVAAKDGQLLVEVVQLDTRNIAFCISVIDSRGAGELASLFVDEAYRNQGIGRRLVASAMQWFSDFKADPVVVDVMHGNDAALQLYEEFGFVQRVHRLQRIKSPESPTG